MYSLIRFIASEVPSASEQAILASVRQVLDQELRRKSTPPGPHRYRRVDCPVSEENKWDAHLLEVKAFLRAYSGIIRQASQGGLRVVLQATLYSSDIAGDKQYVCLTVCFDREVLSLLAELAMDLDVCAYAVG